MNITTVSDNGTPVRKDYSMGHSSSGDDGKKISCRNLYHTKLFQSNTHFGTSSLFHYSA